MAEHSVLELSQALMSIPSITPEDNQCQEILIERLQALGFTITRLPCEGASNFWATYGDNQPTFVFAGHTDVVPAGPLSEWLTNPFEPTVKDGFLYGRGAVDMKAALAAMLVAAEQFIKAHTFSGQIAFLITSAEEGPSEIGTPIVLDYLREQNISMDYCLIGEPTAENVVGDMIKNGRRGSLSGKLIVQGKQGHIAYPHLADNPIHPAMAALDEFCQVNWDQGSEYFQPTCLQISNIHAGTGAGNVIPDTLEVDFNFRYSPAISHEALQEKTKEIFNKHGLNFKISWNHSGKPFLTSDGELLSVCKQAIQEICQHDAKVSTNGGTSDGRFIAEDCMEVIELGPCNHTAHKINECVSIQELNTLTKIYKKILTLIFKK